MLSHVCAGVLDLMLDEVVAAGGRGQAGGPVGAGGRRQGQPLGAGLQLGAHSQLARRGAAAVVVHRQVARERLAQVDAPARKTRVRCPSDNQSSRNEGREEGRRREETGGKGNRGRADTQTDRQTERGSGNIHALFYNDTLLRH